MLGGVVVEMYFVFFFFFQAEDGIRDLTVTGVQTCALPILGNAIPGGTPRAEIDVHTVLPDLPYFVKPATTLSLTAKVKNLSARPFRKNTTSGRRLVRLGAQLMAADGTLINRDYARAWLPDDLPPGHKTQIQIDIPTPDKPGRYGLKFDLVSEGVDWFEAAGSPTITRGLWVNEARS